MENNFLASVRELTQHIKFNIFEKEFFLSSDVDKINGGRVFIQVYYIAPCNKTNEVKQWKGGKHYLSTYMTEDEIVKRCYVAFEATVKHEIMEGFTFDDVVVFNPHVNFRELLKISHLEVSRQNNIQFDF